MLQNFCNLVSD